MIRCGRSTKGGRRRGQRKKKKYSKNAKTMYAIEIV
jgi:hypothetical protein